MVLYKLKIIYITRDVDIIDNVSEDKVDKLLHWIDFKSNSNNTMKFKISSDGNISKNKTVILIKDKILKIEIQEKEED